MRTGLSFAALALAACQPAPPAQNANQVRIAVGPITSAEELEGAYRVADIEGIDMAELDRGFAVMISRDEIDVLENCVSTHWTYRFERGRLVTKPVRGPTCRRALMPEERALMDGFDGAAMATRTTSNGILIEGGGPAITLYSQ